MIVYRVEHESIRSDYIDFPCGPCKSQNITLRLAWDYPKLDAYLRAVDKLIRHLRANEEKFPTPANDPGLGWIDPDEVCGVNSMEAVHEWFADSLPLLEEAGFRITKYEVPDRYCLLGRTGQVVFQYKHATKIEETV